MPGQVRNALDNIPAYRPGMNASQAKTAFGVENAIKLSSNESSLPPLPQVAAAIARAATEPNRYPDHRAAELRRAIASWVRASADQVAVGCGSVGLLAQLISTYVDPEDEVVFPWLSFEAYPILTILAGGTPVTTPLVDFGFDLQAVAAAVTKRTKLILLSLPNNPTATTKSTAEVRNLLENVPPEVMVVLDEAYKDYVDASFGDSIAELLPDFDNVVVLRTFSKAHGLAALRVGYAVAHPETISAIDKTLLPFAVNSIGQAAALASIAVADVVAERARETVAERTRVEKELATAGWIVPQSHANCIYVPLGEATDPVNSALAERGVLVRAFSGEGIRVTVATAAENDAFLRSFIDATDVLGLTGSDSGKTV